MGTKKKKGGVGGGGGLRNEVDLSSDQALAERAQQTTQKTTTK